jgi:adenylate cyclase class 2
MQFEIERKARVHDAAGLRAALTARFGAPTSIVAKEDAYFIEAGVDLARPAAMRSRVVRLRRRDDGTAVATAKRRTLVGATEVNQETEFGVGDGEAFEEFVTRYLGFEPLVEKKKRTEAFAGGEGGALTIELSEVVGLGWFLEVEFLADDAAEEGRAVGLIDGVFAEFAAFVGEAEPRQYIVMLLEAAGRIPPGGTGFSE